MLYSEILGQQRSKTFLQNLAASDRVPHALLFLGKTGSGNLALAFAQNLQCEKPDDDGPCGACNACGKAAHFTHPDIHFSFPTVGAKEISTNFLKEWRAALAESAYLEVNSWLQKLGAENKQGNITADECSAIMKKLSLKIFEGRRKILLMWLPEYLGKEGNRLLKLIEEPPENTVFLLVAENADLILPTVLSRCQLVKTDVLSDEEVAEGLISRHQIEPERARQLAFLADGDFNLARQLAENPDSDDARRLLDWLRKCWQGKAQELLAWTDEFAKLGRENQKQFLQYGLNFIRELLLLTTLGPDHAGRLRLPAAELENAQRMAKVLDFQKVERLAEIFNDNIFYVERNANPRILFLDSSLRMHRILKGS